MISFQKTFRSEMRIGWLLACWLPFATRWSLAPVAAAEPNPAPEYKVKAAYLANFVRYVDWPACSFPTTKSPVVIGVLDAGEALPALQKYLDGKTVEGHPVILKAIVGKQIGSVNPWHILFVTRQAEKIPEELRTALGDSPTLLVGETEQFAERGGAVGFVLENESVRLTLCLENATEKGLKVSAKLSGVAKAVRPKTRNR